ncbi:MAG: MarR family transcriptional regulator [Dehalococcoidia bacterium]|nr:MarR family transcriptional regulator [Dehalococcoidia bacterium]
MGTNVTPYGKRELWALLSQASNALGRVADSELSQVGISMMQAAVLVFVKNSKEPVIPAHISRWLFREPHTVSQLLMRMEKQGLVKRTKNLDRKNQVRITLTEKGEKAFQQQSEMRGIGRILSVLTPEECNKLGASLKKLRDEAIKELDTRPRHLPFP